MIEILKQELPFILALVVCTIAHTIIGGVKHYEDFDFKKLLLGAIKFALVLLVIVMLVVALNLYEPLQVKFADEMEALKQIIVIGVFAKVIVLIKDYFEIKDEDVQEKINENNGVSE